MVCGGGVIDEVGVMVTFLVIVTGMVNEYVVDFTETDLGPYLVVQSFADEIS